MNMQELAIEYRRSAALLNSRIEALQLSLSNGNCTGEMEKMRLRRRINTLTAMYRQALDAAYTMERYYERGYRRSARYTL